MSKGRAAGIAGLLLLAACNANRDPVTTGIPGATQGTVINSQVLTGAGEPRLGAVEGGLLGADVGRSIGDDDRAIAHKAEYEALEYGRAGRPIEWRNDASGNRGQIVVGPTYEVNRLDCRIYTHTVTIEGRARVAKGTACREPDGDWRSLG